MPGLENFIQKKKEFKEGYEELKNESRLIAIDGPDGVGKTEIAKRVVEKLKEKFKAEGKNPDDVVYLKYTKLRDTESQERISEQIGKCKDETGAWDKIKIDHILKLWSAKLNRSYGDFILPLIKEGKTIIFDRSEIDVFRAAMEWGNQELLDKIIEYMKEGTLTHGINAGNRVFISAPAEEIQKNLNERNQPLSSNDPRTLDEIVTRIEKEIKAEKFIMEINENEKPNLIEVKNGRLENEEERDAQWNKIAEEIISKLKFID